MVDYSTHRKTFEKNIFGMEYIIEVYAEIKTSIDNGDYYTPSMSDSDFTNLEILKAEYYDEINDAWYLSQKTDEELLSEIELTPIDFIG
jgi:hypothetical protein